MTGKLACSPIAFGNFNQHHIIAMKFFILACILFMNVSDLLEIYLLFVKFSFQVHGQSSEQADYEEGTTASPEEEDYLEEPQTTEKPRREVVSYSSKQKADFEQICMEKTKLDQELKDLVMHKIYVEPMKDYLMCVMRDSKAWLPSTGFSMPHTIALYRLKGLTDEKVEDILETCIDKNKSTEDLYDYVVSLQCCVVDCILREQYNVMKNSQQLLVKVT